MKRTKKITTILKSLSKGLPRQEYAYINTISEKGSDLIQRNLKHDADGLPILSYKIYSRKVVEKKEVNHENRIKSAFDANGFEGVKKYLTPLVKEEKREAYFLKLKAFLC